MDNALTPRRKRRRFFRKEDAALYIMATPVTIYLIIFAYIPMVGLLMAFQKFNVVKGFFGSPFIGFKNFQFMFATSDAFIYTRNTILYNIAFIIVNMLLSVFMAVILSMLRSARTAKLLQTIYMMPYFISWSVVSIILSVFISAQSGIVNQFLSSLGGEKVVIDWYMTKSMWPALLIITNAWKGVGYATVLYLAVISGISMDYYDAAMIDGANKFQQARYITIPHLRFIVSIQLILSMRNIVRGDFGLHFVVPRLAGMQYLNSTVGVIDTYIYNALIRLTNVGMSSAAGLLQSAAGLLLVLAANWIVTKIDSDSAMF